MLARAETVGNQIITAIAAKDHASLSVAEASEMRTRAFSLFLAAYDEVRRVVTCLRWYQRDAATLVPSVYAGRSSAKRERPSDAPPSTDVSIPTDANATDAPPIAPPPVTRTSDEPFV